jgi:hypothetical protein
MRAERIGGEPPCACTVAATISSACQASEGTDLHGLRYQATCCRGQRNVKTAVSLEGQACFTMWRVDERPVGLLD